MPLSLVEQYLPPGSFCISGSISGTIVQRNSFHHLTKKSFAMSWTCLHFLLLNSAVFKKGPGGSKTTYDFIIIKMLLGYSCWLFWSNPRVPSVMCLEFKIASVSASSVLSNWKFNVGWTETIEFSLLTVSACPELLPFDWMLVGFYAK